MQLTSRVQNTDATHRRVAADRGIVLLDLVVAMALLALLLFLALPYLPHGTTASRLGAYAADVAALLKTDRTAAARTGHDVASQVDIVRKRVTSGATGRTILLPADVTLDMIASDACTLQDGQFAVIFASDGRSCGAVLSLALRRIVWRIRVNWLTGFIDVVPPQRNG